MSGSASRAPLAVTGEILTTKPVGPYFLTTIIAPGVAQRYRPGNVLSLAVGGALSDRMARRTLTISRVRSGATGSTIDVAYLPDEPGLQWLAQASSGTTIDVVGPVGRPFALPKIPVPCLLVGYGVAAAGIFALAERLRERACEVHMLLAAPTEKQLWGALDARRLAKSVTVVTADGSVGIAGSALPQIPEILRRINADVVYAAGPDALLHGVAAAAEAQGAWSQTAISMQMPCGTGLCQGCAFPVVGADGMARQVRACTEGPVFRGDRVRWGAIAGIVLDEEFA